MVSAKSLKGFAFTLRVAYLLHLVPLKWNSVNHRLEVIEELGCNLPRSGHRLTFSGLVSTTMLVGQFVWLIYFPAFLILGHPTTIDLCVTLIIYFCFLASFVVQVHLYFNLELYCSFVNTFLKLDETIRKLHKKLN